MTLFGRRGKVVVGCVTAAALYAGFAVSVPEVGGAQSVVGGSEGSPVPAGLVGSVVKGDPSKGEQPPAAGGGSSLGVPKVLTSGLFDSNPRRLDRRSTLDDTAPRPPWLSELTGPDGSLAVRESSDADRSASKTKPKLGGKLVDRATAKIPAVRVKDPRLSRGENAARVAAVKAALLGSPVRAEDPSLAGPRVFVDDDLSVELPELRTVSSKTYVNPDGTRSVRLFQERVHVKGPGGGWVDVDPTLSVVGDEVRGSAGLFESSFARVASPGAALVSLDFDGTGNRKVSFSLVGSSGARAVVDGSRVTWPSIVPGADLVSVQKVGAVKSEVVVRDRTAASVYRFEYKVPKGWSFRSALAGALELLDDSGVVIGVVEPASALDAKGAPGPAKWANDLSGKGPALVLSVDSGWLGAAVLPVVIDPNVSIGVGVNPVSMMDAMVWAVNPNTSYPAGIPSPYDLIMVGSWGGGVSRGLFRHEIPLSLVDRPVVNAYWRPFIDAGLVGSGVESRSVSGQFTQR